MNKSDEMRLGQKLNNSKNRLEFIKKKIFFFKYRKNRTKTNSLIAKSG